MQYKPKNFTAEEIVDRETFEKLGARSFMLFRPEALRMLDGLRDFLGVPLVINDWHRGGQYQYSGYRPASCTVGAKYSAHRLGCAFDLKPKGLTISAAWAKIQGSPNDPRLALLRRVENISATPTWLHVDTYEHDGAGILVVNP
jgi:hypothetical protein